MKSRLTDDDKCESCPEILEELETIDDDTDKHGIQFVKSNDAKLAAEIGVFSFPALVYYETGVPIMYDGKCMSKAFILTSHYRAQFLFYDPYFKNDIDRYMRSIKKMRSQELRALCVYLPLTKSLFYIRLSLIKKKINQFLTKNFKRTKYFDYYSSLLLTV